MKIVLVFVLCSFFALAVPFFKLTSSLNRIDEKTEALDRKVEVFVVALKNMPYFTVAKGGSMVILEEVR